MDSVWHKDNFKAVLYSEFSFSELVVVQRLNYFTLLFFFIAGAGRDVVMFCLRAFARDEMKAASPRAWTRHAKCISYEDNRYATWSFYIKMGFDYETVWGKKGVEDRKREMGSK